MILEPGAQVGAIMWAHGLEECGFAGFGEACEVSVIPDHAVGSMGPTPVGAQAMRVRLTNGISVWATECFLGARDDIELMLSDFWHVQRLTPQQLAEWRASNIDWWTASRVIARDAFVNRINREAVALVRSIPRMARALEHAEMALRGLLAHELRALGLPPCEDVVVQVAPNGRDCHVRTALCLECSRRAVDVLAQILDAGDDRALELYLVEEGGVH